jgi:hypothetical protein
VSVVEYGLSQKGFDEVLACCCCLTSITQGQQKRQRPGLLLTRRGVGNASQAALPRLAASAATAATKIEVRRLPVPSWAFCGAQPHGCGGCVRRAAVRCCTCEVADRRPPEALAARRVGAAVCVCTWRSVFFARVSYPRPTRVRARSYVRPP